MTITSYGTGAYRAAKPNEFVSTRARFDDLQRQLDTKQRSTSYGDLGIDRRLSLDLNGKVAQIDSWLSGIELTNVNLKLSSQSVETFAKIAAEARNDMRSNSYVPTAGGRSAPQVLAEEKLKQTLDLLNTSVNGRYLFSGKTSDTQPTASFDEIMNGDGAGKVGLRQLIEERRLADVGNGRGRLTTDMPTTTSVTVTDQNSVYGFKLSGAMASGTALVATYSNGAPSNLAVDVTAQPQPGDTVKLKLTLPDGTQEEVVLTARAAGTDGAAADTFEIGATPADTAGALRVSIERALEREAKTTLPAASAQMAAADFFAGSTSAPPKRVPGPDFATTVTPPSNAGTDLTTVTWYRGDDGNDPARNTATVQIDQGQVVGTGARANEQAFRVGLAQFAIMAVSTFPASDPEAQAGYDAMAARVGEKLGFGGATQKPAEIITELGTAQNALASAKERHQSTKGYLQTTLSGVENVTTEEVATQILSLQTQLQASYQVTSMLSKLSLTNYL
ncbi:MAG: hypothetical protein J0I42_03685 [Bosea sp.]|uniref:flagellin n=1 Tax=Bosea sp. (in: a-proteobacteria) TaxID=1871050 RepID=UPI001AC1C02A|nr:flagellin [Bosea sp. (in: a-proteobacteria)]MBN9451031.1 hypothetical protein [Bosea sp. (in: a-proteobacteria)]